MISAAQDRIHVKKDGNRAEQDHDKAKGCYGGSVGQKQLPQIGFAQQPDGAHDHTPAQILHVKFGLVYNAQGNAEQYRYHTGKQNKGAHDRLRASPKLKARFPPRVHKQGCPPEMHF